MVDAAVSKTAEDNLVRVRLPLPARLASRYRVRVDSRTSTEAIRALLSEVAETHHRVYRIVDGNDPDWASWYADWLINLSELPSLLGARPVRSELVYLLVKLDKEFTAAPSDGGWEKFYAQELVRALGTGA
jgi:hypothetical protein